MVQLCPKPERDALKVNIYANSQAKLTTACPVVDITKTMLGLSTATITIHNLGAGDVIWDIYGTFRDTPTIVAFSGTDDDDEGWVLDSSGTIATGAAPTVTCITKPYTQIVTRLSHMCCATTVDTWFKGSSCRG